ncbi:hypothetical protein IQ241_00350 [Romeria aff. gracilis LEGE 07310]|uniref:Outer membrane protein beta-barrel domain-containing protein n=1 Tax=Vasconcelosia minhoensis LEGE 07310 TaxID=915328 RepID=A0A8J7A9P5_9CYAN|nr:hypothetical protein [Romeria gracilis]MBE9075764.1 hypothetical protein [Romeria aff. gracilis LEGE 07310]
MTLLKQLTGTTGLVLLSAIATQLAASAQFADPAVESALDRQILEIAQPSEQTQPVDQQTVSEELDPASLKMAEVPQPSQPQIISEMPVELAEPISASAESGEFAQVRRRRPPVGAPSSFIGIGGNIGFGDDGVPGGDPAFAVISKLAFSRRLSVRPAALIGDDVSFLIPVTYSFGALPGPGRFALQPYVGGGAAFSTGDDSEVTGLVSAGLDVPLSRDFTANGQANLSLGDESGFGVTLGVGYNFGQVFQ